MKTKQLEQLAILYMSLTGIVPGKLLFEWYTTYGIDPSLVEIVAERNGCVLDWDGFYLLMENHSLVSGKGTLMGNDTFVMS
jgi:alanyl-tRNA synthetase